MAHIDHVYKDLVLTLLTEGFTYQDKSRANITMLEIPSYQLDIDITKGFPLLTTKKMYWKIMAHELIWMLSGEDNIDYLQHNNVKIWDKDARNFSKGTHVGRIYGAQWRSWGTRPETRIDQIKNLIEGLKSDLYTRRHLVTAWNPSELEDMALPPCHWAFQVMPARGGFALKWFQRSCDVFLGIPFDIGLYAFLGKLIEAETGIRLMRLIGDLTCVHLYGPHVPLIQDQMQRRAMTGNVELTLAKSASVDNININDFQITGYVSHPPIKAEMYAKVKNK